MTVLLMSLAGIAQSNGWIQLLCDTVIYQSPNMKFLEKTEII
jgi:hypothetical protein